MMALSFVVAGGSVANHNMAKENMADGMRWVESDKYHLFRRNMVAALSILSSIGMILVLAALADERQLLSISFEYSSSK